MTDSYVDSFNIVVESINSRPPQDQIAATYWLAETIYDYCIEEIKASLISEIASDLLAASQQYRREQNEILRKL